MSLLKLFSIAAQCRLAQQRPPLAVVDFDEEAGSKVSVKSFVSTLGHRARQLQIPGFDGPVERVELGQSANPVQGAPRPDGPTCAGQHPTGAGACLATHGWHRAPALALVLRLPQRQRPEPCSVAIPSI
jgi:hypothetical protein